MKELESTINEVNKDIEAVDERCTNLDNERAAVISEKKEVANFIAEKEQKAKERILPEIQRVERLIEEGRAEMAAGLARIEKEEQ